MYVRRVLTNLCVEWRCVCWDFTNVFAGNWWFNWSQSYIAVICSYHLQEEKYEENIKVRWEIWIGNCCTGLFHQSMNIIYISSSMFVMFVVGEESWNMVSNITNTQALDRYRRYLTWHEHLTFKPHIFSFSVISVAEHRKRPTNSK